MPTNHSPNTMAGGIVMTDIKVVVMTILTEVVVSPPYSLVKMIGKTAAGIAAWITSTFFNSGETWENFA